MADWRAAGQVGYPTSGAFPGTSDFRTNWTIGSSVTVPVFTGYRLKASELAARADLAEAQAQLKQVRELSMLDSATAKVFSRAVTLTETRVVPALERAHDLGTRA